MKVEEYNTPQYKRSQAEWALWQSFHRRNFSVASEEIGLTFLNRIKRLLDIDTKLVETQTKVSYAFISKTNSNIGNGKDRSFSTYDVFHIGLGLDLLDAGFNQQDVIFILQHFRPDMDDYLGRVMTYPLWKRDERIAEDVPKAPITERNGIKFADMRTFLVFYKTEFREFSPNQKVSKQPIIVAPCIAFGYEALTKYLDQDSYRQPYHFIFEISRLATEIRESLKEAPIVKRGRKQMVIKGDKHG